MQKKSNPLVKLFHFVLTLLLIIPAVFLLSSASSAESFPQRPISFMLPGGPGGGFDTYTRALARFMPKHLPREVNIVAVNMPGAGGKVCTSYIYRSKPNGYTIGFFNQPGTVVTELLERNPGYKVREVTWLGTVATVTYVMLVPGSSNIKTLEDLKKLGRPVKFGSNGFGQTDFLIDILASEEMGIPFVMVTGYTGSAAVMVAALRGDVDAMSYPISSALPNIKSGDLRPIILLGDKRSDILPDVPTSTELGFPNVANFASMYRMVGGPPKIPGSIKNVLAGALEKTIKDPEVQAWSKKANRPLNFINVDKTNEIADSMFKTFQKYLDTIKKHKEKLN